MEPHTGTSGLHATLLNERGRLLRFLAARGASHDAEDVLHDLWQKIAAAPERPVADPVSYLFRAAENHMRDIRRATTSREKRQFDWQGIGNAPEDEPVGERVLIAREQLQHVQAALAGLGARVDHVFRRYRLDGIGQADIASELGMSLSSVEKDLQKAYRTLADLRIKLNTE
jgi:RNA polymerase sigma-70 factor (ECF subfamily)